MRKTLIVFDLDFTIWDAGGTWCDHTRGPYSHLDGSVFDADGLEIRLYPGVSSLLKFLKDRNHPLALASRTHSPATARTLLKMFEIDVLFDFQEIYPGSKTRHFQSLQADSGIPYMQMYFFDDEYRNIEEVGRLGVNAYHVRNGLGPGEFALIRSVFAERRIG